MLSRILHSSRFKRERERERKALLLKYNGFQIVFIMQNLLRDVFDIITNLLSDYYLNLIADSRYGKFSWCCIPVQAHRLAFHGFRENTRTAAGGDVKQ